MAINWDMAIAPDIIGNALTAFEQGKVARREEATRNALGSLVANPNDQASFTALAQNDPALAMQYQGQQQQQQAQKQKAEQEKILIMGKLLRHAKDPATYAQALQAAQQYGLDVSTAPQQFDPAWVQRNLMIVDAFEKDQGQQFSGMARELMDAGYKPGTPEFATAMQEGFNGKYGTKYVDGQGNERRSNPLQGAPRIPEAAIAELRSNPGTADKFDEIFGPGASARILGGPTQPASGGFRPVGISGERVTSTTRTAARNRAVGGVANSYHLSGRARDSVPPPGMSMAAYAAQLKRLNPHLDVINEGDHVHMEPR